MTTLYKQQRMFGTWASPLTSKMLGEITRLNDVQFSRDGKTLIWHEGSNVVIQREHDAPRTLTDSSMSARSSVGYGGSAIAVGDEVVLFAGNGGRVYRQALQSGLAQPITPPYGNFIPSRVSPDGRWLLGVFNVEDHDGIYCVDVEGQHWPQKWVDDTDFAMQPVWSHDGKQAACIVWDHPHMPWDATELRLLTVTVNSEGFPTVTATKTVAGDANTSVFQPEFSPNGQWLSYVSDVDGFWNLYLYDLKTEETHQLTFDVEGEYATPAWVQSLRTYGWTGDSRYIIALRNHHNRITPVRIDVQSGNVVLLDAGEYTAFSQISVSQTEPWFAVCAASTTLPSRIVTASYLPDEEPQWRVIRRSSNENLVAGDLSVGQSISWPTSGDGTAYGIFYPPTSSVYVGEGQPPLLVYVHGGPTGQEIMDWSNEAQYFATRGFAVLLVNHRGGTGFGKAYKDMHRAQWGVWDVDDSFSGAEYVASQGWSHPTKRIIMGGSAGGFTVLQSLVTKPGAYSAGVCLYGVANQFSLLLDAEFKFESRYSETLLGLLPQSAELYRERSPLFNAHKIVDPIILFQGDQDRIVPKSQSDGVVAALRRSGVPHEYHVYEGEGHGWRKPETIADYLQKTLKFIEQYVLYV